MREVFVYYLHKPVDSCTQIVMPGLGQCLSDRRSMGMMLAIGWESTIHTGNAF